MSILGRHCTSGLFGDIFNVDGVFPLNTCTIIRLLCIGGFLPESKTALKDACLRINSTSFTWYNNYKLHKIIDHLIVCT